MSYSNNFQFTKRDLKNFFELTKLISKYAPEFVDIANKRDIVIKKLFTEFKSSGHLDNGSLSDLKDCIADEYDLKSSLAHRVDKASFLFDKLNLVALKTFKEASETSGWTFKFKSFRFYSLLLKQWPLIKNLFFLFRDYLDHLDQRAAIEKEFINSKATGMLLRKSELRTLWQKDKVFFNTFSSYVNDLTLIVTELKKANIVSLSLFGSGSLASFTLAFVKSFSENGFTGWAAVVFCIFISASMYNLAIYMVPASKKESEAVNILDSFNVAVNRMKSK